MNKNIEYIINLTSELNAQHNYIYIPGLIIVVDYNIFIGLLKMNCRRFQGTDEGIRFMVFNATFNTILVILWQSALLVEETQYPE